MDPPKRSPMDLARLINHQHQIISKIEEIAKLIENVQIAKSELKLLLDQSAEKVIQELGVIEPKKQ